LIGYDHRRRSSVKSVSGITDAIQESFQERVSLSVREEVHEEASRTLSRDERIQEEAESEAMMTDEEIKDAQDVIRQRMSDPKRITHGRRDLSGDISCFLLGDTRIDRDMLVKRIEDELQRTAP